MKVKTRRFGEIDIAEDRILKMPSGMLGFPGKERYTLLEREETRPFCWFQSVDDPDLALLVMNPFLFKPDYRIDLKGVIKEMGWGEVDASDILIYVVVNTWEGEARRITANLIGPIIINTGKGQAVQKVIADSPYSHQHDVLGE